MVEWLLELRLDNAQSHTYIISCSMILGEIKHFSDNGVDVFTKSVWMPSYFLPKNEIKMKEQLFAAAQGKTKTAESPQAWTL